MAGADPGVVRVVRSNPACKVKQTQAKCFGHTFCLARKGLVKQQ